MRKSGLVHAPGIWAKEFEPARRMASQPEANWRVGPAQKPVSVRSCRGLSFTPEVVGLRPFSVGHVEQPWRTACEPGDLAIAWT